MEQTKRKIEAIKQEKFTSWIIKHFSKKTHSMRKLILNGETIFLLKECLDVSIVSEKKWKEWEDQQNPAVKEIISKEELLKLLEVKEVELINIKAIRAKLQKQTEIIPIEVIYSTKDYPETMKKVKLLNGKYIFYLYQKKTNTPEVSTEKKWLTWFERYAAPIKKTITKEILTENIKNVK